jgi:DNA-binding response OmpR family regulator
MNLLIIEDDPEISSSLRSSFLSEGYAVDVATDGATGLYKAKVSDYDLVILDIGLPKKDGREVCREIRAYGKMMPIIILTVKSEIEDKKELFELGADDYLTKPFFFTELSSRVRACLRRPRKLEENVLKIGTVTLNNTSRSLTSGKYEIHCTPKEFFMLEYLMKNRNRVISRQEILEHVWGGDADLFSNKVETHLANLRKKLKGKAKKDFICTVPNGGYKIC